MANTRRGFLQSGAALAAGLTGAGSVLAGQTAAQPPAPGTGPVQVPKMKFGKVEISRMVLGVNPFYGYAHNVGTYGAMMQEWYTQERVVGVIHSARAMDSTPTTTWTSPVLPRTGRASAPKAATCI